jgi:hypothetical protein
MTAFSYNDTYALEANIRAMGARLDAVSWLPLTHEDFLTLFVPLNERTMYRDMAKLTINKSGRTVEYNWKNSASLMFQINEVDGALAIPRPRELSIQPDAEHVEDKIDDWLTNGVHASRDFGRVLKVFSVLNQTVTASTMRFYWPSIMTIAAESPTTETVLERLRGMDKVAKVALPAGLPTALRKTAPSVIAAALLSKGMSDRPPAEVAVRSARAERYNEPGIGGFHGLVM